MVESPEERHGARGLYFLTMVTGATQPTPLSADRLPRVLVVAKRAPDTFADNILTCLEDAGYETRSVEPFQGPLDGSGRLATRARAEVPQSPRLARRLQAHVVDAAREFGPDLTLVLDHRLSYPIVGELRKASQGPVAFWFPGPPATWAGRCTSWPGTTRSSSRTPSW